MHIHAHLLEAPRQVWALVGMVGVHRAAGRIGEGTGGRGLGMPLPYSGDKGLGMTQCDTEREQVWVKGRNAAHHLSAPLSPARADRRTHAILFPEASGFITVALTQTP